MKKINQLTICISSLFFILFLSIFQLNEELVNFLSANIQIVLH